MKKYLFVDLDDTLFQTLRKLPIELNHQAHVANNEPTTNTSKNNSTQSLTIGSYYRDGSPCSWLTTKQQAWWHWLNQDSIVIPVTARTHDAFERVTLPFQDLAIINFGAQIIQADGMLDSDWQAKMQKNLSPYEAILQSLYTVLSRYAQQHANTLRIEFTHSTCTASLPLYVLLKDNHKNIDVLKRTHQDIIVDWLTSHPEFYVHHNDNNLAILPKALNKAYAVDYVIKQLKQKEDDILTCGMGDSLSDFAFISCCDYWIVPNSSQLANQIHSNIENFLTP